MWNHITYSLKIWITSVVASPALYILYDLVFHQGQNGRGAWQLMEAFQLMFLFLGIGIIFSVPNFCLLMIVNYFVFKLKNVLYIKILNQVVVVILCFGLFALLFPSFNEEDLIHELQYFYALALSFGVWFYDVFKKPQHSSIASAKI